MAYCKTQGIVVRKADFSETSLVLTFLTPDYGKIGVMAKGAKRAGKKAVGSLDTLCLAEIVFLQKPASLHLLTEYEVKDYFSDLHRSLQRLHAADYAAELVRGSVEEGPCPEVFDLVLAALRCFAAGGDLAPYVFGFELKLLAALGYRPDLEGCASCAGEARPPLYFDAAAGGVVCARCRTDRSSLLSPGARATMRRLLDVELPSLGRLRIAPPVRAEIKRAVRAHIEFSLNRRPRLWRYLDV